MARGQAGPRRRAWRRTAITIATVLLGVPAASVPAASAATDGGSDRVLEVKFRDGSDVRVRGDQFVDGADRQLAPILDRYRGVAVAPLFRRPVSALRRERQRTEARSGRRLPDLELWYRVAIAPGQPIDELVGELNRIPELESAERAPLAAPPPATPSFVGRQGYLLPAPVGIDATTAASVPGGRGDRARLFDLEYAWNRAHEDLAQAAYPDALIPNGTPVDPFSDTGHGTAVLGELVGDDDAIGVTGAVPDAGLTMINVYNGERGWDLANAVNLAQSASEPGDVVLIEQQTYGPRGEYVPVEWLPSVYDAITTATAAGVIVIEPAANGKANLDDPSYGKRFPEGRPDSGAILVGAGAAPCNVDQLARSRLPFSGYGKRVNLQGWGECVTTTGYGNLWGNDLTGATDWYTAGFSGTSSASAIVAGSAAAFASAYERANGAPPTPARVRQVLVSSGTAQSEPRRGHVGPLPNLSSALSAKNLRPPAGR